MIITKRYSPKNINFHLLPSLMEKIKVSAESEKKFLNTLNLSFSVNTISQTVETDNSTEFVEILRSLSEPVVVADAEVNYQYYNMLGADFEKVVTVPVFKFSYNHNSIEIVLTQKSSENIKNLFTEIEETLSLETIKPKILEEKHESRERTIFVAHSFDQSGKSYAYELNQFLTLIKFKVSTGEGYSPESVSRKVRRRLSSQEVVIIIVSRKEDTTWLTQEASGATFLDKPLIILKEEEVEFKSGIHSDLEYIQFKQGFISSTFIPILQGLQELGYTF
jgi:hypothetical protein